MNEYIERCKTCFRCNLILPVTEFYRHAAMKDGFLNKCKACTKQDAQNHRHKNLNEIRQYDRERGRLKHRIELNTKLTAIRRSLYPKQHEAHELVAKGVANGTLKKMNCIICGSSKSMAHHDDYDRPLDVIWLCQVHHKQRHQQIYVERK